MCEPAKGARCAMIVDLALSLTGSQPIASVLPTVRLTGTSAPRFTTASVDTSSRCAPARPEVIWLFDRMHAYYGY
ncbi:hypothetical protein B0H14DRAFT_2730249 [Mycena olivaceomarginata]|nr:hypothetical protein B0H14DRAFT_2730249 [Mycena olivaceomarginata]